MDPHKKKYDFRQAYKPCHCCGVHEWGISIYRGKKEVLFMCGICIYEMVQEANYSFEVQMKVVKRG